VPKHASLVLQIVNNLLKSLARAEPEVELAKIERSLSCKGMLNLKARMGLQPNHPIFIQRLPGDDATKLFYLGSSCNISTLV